MLATNKSSLELGDLLLFSAKDDFERAIATSFKPNPQEFHHVAIYYQNNEIIEASQKHGVRKRNLEVGEIYSVYRFKHTINLQQVLINICSKLGCGYNHYFQLTDDQFYCSQLIQYGYNMTSPGTIPYIEMQFNDTADFRWKQYYEQQGIPFNKQGTHPASIILNNFKLIK